jgi:hypothetical protein
MSKSKLLATEIKVFEQHRREWARCHTGEFVVIQDDDVAGFFGDFAEAFRAALKRFGARREFLVRQVWIVDPVYLIFWAQAARIRSGFID